MVLLVPVGLGAGVSKAEMCCISILCKSAMPAFAAMTCLAPLPAGAELM